MSDAALRERAALTLARVFKITEVKEINSDSYLRLAVVFGNV